MLVPPRFLTNPEESGRPASMSRLTWNPRYSVCRPGGIPVQLGRSDDWRRSFAIEDAWTIWVNDVDRNQWRPFVVGEDLAARCAVDDDTAGPRLEPQHLPAAELAALLAAGVVVDPAKQALDSKRWRISTSRVRERFRKRGYASVDRLLHPFHIGEMRRYYRRLIRQGGMPLGDYQSSRRYVAHNEPVARFFHLQLTPAITQLAGERVKPSYVYLASYLEGAELRKHTDREQCEISVTFCLDYAPEPESATPWPIQLQTRRGQVAIAQSLGEALLYRGCKVPHFRDRLPEGHSSTSIFFHYVPVDFSGSLA